MVIKFSHFKSLLVFGVSLCLVLVCGLAFGQANASGKLLRTRVHIAGNEIAGTLILTQRDNGPVRIRGAIQGNPAILTPGLHGLHIHSAGQCESELETPFSSAGGHFDPGPFGNETPVQDNHPYHMGDLPNLVVDAQGRANYYAVTSRVTLSDTPLTLFDSNGSAIIIHQLEDQQIPQTPDKTVTAAEAGGGRIACGIISYRDEYQGSDNDEG